MQTLFEQRARRACACTQQWLWLRWQEIKHCRDCGGSVTPLESICPHCGTSNPARVGVSPSVMIVALGSLAAIVLLLAR
jgi:hypothetical protein